MMTTMCDSDNDDDEFDEDRKYKDYVYRKMLAQEYLKKIKNI